MSVSERLQDVFRRIFQTDNLELSPNFTASDVEGWDSLAHITLMFSIEQEFGIQFTGAEFAEVKTVGDLVALVESKL